MWLGVIGFGLKLVGDQDFLSTVVAYTLKILDIFVRLGEEIGKVIVAAVTPGKKYEMSADIRQAFQQGVAQADLKSGVAGALGLILPSATGPGFVPTLENSEKYLNEKGFGDIFVTQNNNVNVSDKREFEGMLAENNRQLTEDVRRSVT